MRDETRDTKTRNTEARSTEARDAKTRNTEEVVPNVKGASPTPLPFFYPTRP